MIGTKLAAWLEERHISQAACARALGVSAPCVHDWIRGNRIPGQCYREAIDRWTSGAIERDAWLSRDEVAHHAALRQIAPWRSVEEDAG